MSDAVATQRLQPAFAFIFVVVLLDVIAIGVIIPVLPRLLEGFTGSLARASEINGIFTASWALMQLLFSPVLGALSDRFGRRPVILLSCLGLAIDFFLVALAPSLAWLFVARLIGGITMANMSTASAYIADVTPVEQRAARFGMLGAAWGLGFVLGPLLGGWLGASDVRLPFWVAGGIGLANALYGFFVLPESLPPERRSPFHLKAAHPIGALKLLGRTPLLKRLSVVNGLYLFAHQVFPTVFVLHAAYRFQWGPDLVGITLAIVGIASTVVQAALVGRIVARIGERRAMLAGLGCGVIALTLYGLAPTGEWFWVGIAFGAFMGLYGPASQTLMTAEVPPDEQGQLQGANASIMGFTGLAAPLVFAFTFAWAIGGGKAWGVPGAPYLLAATLLGVAASLALGVLGASAKSPEASS